MGDSTVDLSPYRSIQNIHFLGRKPYADLPAYCRQFDVGLIPFKVNELTRAVNPIKLREYLAAGLPVVSTPLPEVRLYERLANLADGPDAFVQRIAAGLNGQAVVSMRNARVEAMAQESWPTKQHELSAALSPAHKVIRIGAEPTPKA